MNAKGQWLGLFLAAAVAFGGLAACMRDRGVEAAREGQPPSVSAADQDFTMKTMQGHLGEVNTARIALQKSDNSEVRDYANMIQSDHNNALKTLSDLMTDKNVPQARTLAPEIQQDISRMNNLTGPEFDREFINMMVQDHQETVEMFRDHLAIVQNPDVKEYIEDLLPKLEMHLDKGKQIQSKLFSRPEPR